MKAGNQWQYSYKWEYTSYKSLLYGSEGHDDYVETTGTLIYKVLGSINLNDTTVVWTIREKVNTKTMEWHLDSLSERDTVYYVSIDSVDNPLYEYTTGFHRLSANTRLVRLFGDFYRFPDKNMDLSQYKTPDNGGTPVLYTYKKNVGLSSANYSTYSVGNMSVNKSELDVQLINASPSVSKPNAQIGQFPLSQNYPNPFNPVTSINYSVSFGMNVKLKIYNILGKEISTLVDEFRQAGNYTVRFNGSGLASGIYFYQIQAEGFCLAKKLTLLK